MKDLFEDEINQLANQMNNHKGGAPLGNRSTQQPDTIDPGSKSWNLNKPMPQQLNDWEKEFDKLFDKNFRCDVPTMKSFITSLLSTQKEEAEDYYVGGLRDVLFKVFVPKGFITPIQASEILATFQANVTQSTT